MISVKSMLYPEAGPTLLSAEDGGQECPPYHI